MSFLTYLTLHYARLTLNTFWTIICALQTTFILILILRTAAHPPPLLNETFDIILLITYVSTAGLLFILMIWAFRRTTDGDSWNEDDGIYQRLSGGDSGFDAGRVQWLEEELQVGGEGERWADPLGLERKRLVSETETVATPMPMMARSSS